MHRSHNTSVMVPGTPRGCDRRSPLTSTGKSPSFSKSLVPQRGTVVLCLGLVAEVLDRSTSPAASIPYGLAVGVASVAGSSVGATVGSDVGVGNCSAHFLTNAATSGSSRKSEVKVIISSVNALGTPCVS